jgi:hypothetical protein
MDGWCLLKPSQRWRDGDVTSPHELESIKEEALGNYVDLSKVKVGGQRHGKGGGLWTSSSYPADCQQFATVKPDHDFGGFARLQRHLLKNRMEHVSHQ